MRTLRKKRANSQERGQALVEFLFSAVFLFVTIFWAIQLFILLYTYGLVAEGAKEGIRYAVVHGSANASSSGPTSGTTSDCTTNITPVVMTVQNYVNYPGMTVSVCYLDGNNKAPNRVQVQVSYPFSSMFNFAWTPPTVRASAL